MNSTRARLGIALLLSLLLLLGFSVRAGAEPKAISNAKNEAEALRAQIEQLRDDLEIQIEAYNQYQAELEETTSSLKKTQTQLKQAEKDLDVANSRLNERLDQIYRAGRLGFVESVFTARSFSDLVNRVELLKRVGVQDRQVLTQVKGYRNQVQDRKKKLTVERDRERKLVVQAKNAKARVQSKLAQQKEALRGKEQLIAQLEREEEARQAQLAQLARQAAQQAAAARSSRLTTSNASAGGSSASEPVSNPGHSRTGAAVVSIAMRYIGVPYVWGGASPSGFDCSGLTMYVYGKVGVSLPHSSRMQYGSGTPVSKSNLEPGDLVFFGSPIHHVGIYVGNNSYLHAPYTGSTVRISSMNRSGYAGACRIL